MTAVDGGGTNADFDPSRLRLTEVDVSTSDSSKSSDCVFLDEALATELISVLRSRQSHFRLADPAERPLAMAFLIHSVQAQRNADSLALRIRDLGHEPSFTPRSLTWRSATGFDEGLNSLRDIVGDAIAVERDAGRFYRHGLTLFAASDVVTLNLLGAIERASAGFALELERRMTEFVRD